MRIPCVAVRLLPVFFFLLCSAGRSQDRTPVHSAAADSLAAELLKDPTNRALHLRLVNTYLRNSQPELALLELAYADGAGMLGPEAVEVRGRAQVILEQTAPALRSLTRAYVQNPNDETLVLIGILHHAGGDRRRGSEILRRIGSRIATLPADLLQHYERFYLNGQRRVASGVASALRDLDTTAFQSFFPLPELTILSPAENSSTEAPSTSVIIEVAHQRPVQAVTIGAVEVYNRGDQPMKSVQEPFSRSFTHLYSLREGRNVIPVVAEDVLGFRSTRLLTVNGLSFIPLSSWRAPLLDSLRLGFRRLQAYVPEEGLLARKSPDQRGLVISGGTGPDSASLFEQGSFLAELLSHAYSGLSEPSAVKSLVQDRCSRENIEIVSERWLLREATFRTRTVMILNGRWRLESERWMLEDHAGQWTDVKVMLESLLRLATGGVAVLVAGVRENQAVLVSGLNALVLQSAAPAEVLILPPDTRWLADLVRSVTDPDAQGDSTAEPVDISLQSLSSSIPGAVRVTNNREVITVSRNPAAAVANLHRRVLQQAVQLLAAARMTRTQRDRVVQFCSDWRRTGELQRYLRRELTAEDLLERAEEYATRTRRNDAGE